MHLLVGIKWSCTKKEKEGKESVLITKINIFFFCSEGWTSAVTLAQSLTTLTELTSVLHGPPGVTSAGSSLKRGRPSRFVGLRCLVFRLPAAQKKYCF